MRTKSFKNPSTAYSVRDSSHIRAQFPRYNPHCPYNQSLGVSGEKIFPLIVREDRAPPSRVPSSETPFLSLICTAPALKKHRA